MIQLIQVDSGQYSFDPLVFEEKQNLDREEARKAALAARGALRKAIERDHPGRYDVKAWTLTGQLRKWKCWGVPCGRVRNVYYLNVMEK